MMVSSRFLAALLGPLLACISSVRAFPAAQDHGATEVVNDSSPPRAPPLSAQIKIYPTDYPMPRRYMNTEKSSHQGDNSIADVNTIIRETHDWERRVRPGALSIGEDQEQNKQEQQSGTNFCMTKGCKHDGPIFIGVLLAAMAVLGVIGVVLCSRRTKTNTATSSSKSSNFSDESKGDISSCNSTRDSEASLQEGLRTSETPRPPSENDNATIQAGKASAGVQAPTNENRRLKTEALKWEKMRVFSGKL